MLTEGEGGRRSWLGEGLTTTGDDDGDLGKQWLPATSSEACEASAAPPVSTPAAKMKTELRRIDPRSRTGDRRCGGSPATT